MLSPEAVLLHKPSMGLAPFLVEKVFNIIQRLKAQGVAMLLVEHFAAAALNVADYGYVLENGRISEYGPAKKIESDPAARAAYLRGWRVTSHKNKLGISTLLRCGVVTLAGCAFRQSYGAPTR